MTEIHGNIDPAFAHLHAAFADGFSSGREVGAHLVIIVDGQVVVDLHAGYTDRKKEKPWRSDTLCCFFSVSKALTTTVLLGAVADGEVDLDAPVARYWPEFAQADKSEITVRQLMSHQAGLPAFDEPVEREIYYDWDRTCAQLAMTTPWWTPGTDHGYHARSFGFLLGEVVCRVKGMRFRDVFDAWVAPPQIELCFGLDDVQMTRCADMLPAKIDPARRNSMPEGSQNMLRDLRDPQTLTGAVFQNPNLGPGYMNKPAFRQAVMPAVNGHGSARGVAEFFAQIPQWLPESLLQEAATTHSQGHDKVLQSPTRFGLGYMLHDEQAPVGWSGCLGHAGAGGSLGFVDPHRNVAFAYVMNQMEEGVVTGGTSANKCADALFDHIK
ncbi:MAG: serine hydrolase domain-containing protein [Pseudomonadota bacterium]